MPSIGTQELIIILVVALVIFGPRKLPEIGRSIGQGLRELRRASRTVMDSLEDDADEPERKPAAAREHTKETEENVADSNSRNY